MSASRPHSGHLDAELNQPEELATQRLVEIARECLQRLDGFPTIPGSRRWSVNGGTALRELDRRQSHLEEQFEATRKALDDACDVAIWLSGLPCLRNSDAWTYWESDARPKLYKAMGLLDSNPASEPKED